MLILTVLRDRPLHGYQLALEVERRSGGLFRFKHGTLYPILHDLEKKGFIAGAWSKEGPRGERKSYALTDRGRQLACESRTAWRQFTACLLDFLGEEEV